VLAVCCPLGRTELAGPLALGLQTARTSAGRGETTQLTVLHGVLADPIDAWVVTDDLVEWIDHDHFVPLVDSIVCHPVRVEHTEASTFAANTLLSNAAEIAGLLDLVHTLISWLTVHNSLGNALLAATTLHADAVDAEALLGLVTEMASLLRTSRAGATMDGWHLAVFPCSDTTQESQSIRLLLAPEFLEVLVGSHLAIRTISRCGVFLNQTAKYTHVNCMHNQNTSDD